MNNSQDLFMMKHRGVDRFQIFHSDSPNISGRALGLFKN
jgi:hypothetical protein